MSDDIIDSVNRAFYNDENIESKDTYAVEEFRIRIEKAAAQNIGRIAYFYHECLLEDIYYRKGGIDGTLRKNTAP